MYQVVDDVLSVMARNRRRHRGWEKVRVDRLEKLLPRTVNTSAFLSVFLSDDRLKHVRRQDDDGNLHPAVQLRFEAFKRFR